MRKSTNKHSSKTMLSLTAAALLAASLPSAGIAAEAPTTGTPQTQTTGAPQTPATDTPQTPATDTSQTPATGTPQTPTTGTPQKPATDTSQTPATGTPQKPATDTPQTPATGTPQKPATDTSQTPATGAPQKPATGTPSAPAATPAATDKDPFYDIVRDPNRDAIMTLYNEGIVKPAKDRKFRPNAEIGRSDFTVILGRAMNAKGSVFDVYYKDPIPDWAIRYVGGLSAAGIYYGYLDGDTFGPKEPVTRAEAAAMVARAAHLESQPLPLDLGGVNNVPIWALDDVGAAYAAGLITVTDTGTLNPNKKVTRSEMAAMIAPLVKTKAFMQPVKIEDDITLP